MPPHGAFEDLLAILIFGVFFGAVGIGWAIDHVKKWWYSRPGQALPDDREVKGHA